MEIFKILNKFGPSFEKKNLDIKKKQVPDIPTEYLVYSNKLTGRYVQDNIKVIQNSLFMSYLEFNSGRVNINIKSKL